MVTFNTNPSLPPGSPVYVDLAENLEALVNGPIQGVALDVGYTLLAYLCKKKTKYPQWEYVTGYHHITDGLALNDRFTKIKQTVQLYVDHSETQWVGYKIMCFQMDYLHPENGAKIDKQKTIVYFKEVLKHYINGPKKMNKFLASKGKVFTTTKSV